MTREQTTTTRSTEQATDILASVYVSCARHGRLSVLMDAARAAGCAWRWDDAARALAAAYRMLGAEPYAPGGAGAGYAWHRGEHPIQRVASTLRYDAYDSTVEWMDALRAHQDQPHMLAWSEEVQS